MRPRHRGFRGGQHSGIALGLLAMQIFRFGIDRIPPVTLSVLVGQIVIYLKLLDIRWPGLGDVCVSAGKVWFGHEWTRLILASFFHTSDWHLYYNMTSFLWKGRSLEQKLGSRYFVYMLGVFSLLVNVVIVGLSLLAEAVMHDPSYLWSCAVGFSGVLFALKVVTTHLMPRGTQYVMGFIPVNSRLACWVELVLIQVLVPNVSFLGHLAGILVGLMYVKGPLKTLMDTVIPTGPSYTYQAGESGRRVGGASYPQAPPTYQRYANDGQASGYTTGAATSGHDGPQQFTGGLSEEEQMAYAMRQSMQDSNGPAEPTAPPPEEPGHPSDPPPPYPGVAPPSYDSIHRHQQPGAMAQGGSRLYPDLNSVDPNPAQAPPTLQRQHTEEEVRRRRLARFGRTE